MSFNASQRHGRTIVICSANGRARRSARAGENVGTNDGARGATRLAAAFTFIELLVVLSVFCLAILMVLPAMARTKNNNSAAQCVENLRRLAIAWSAFNGDNAGKLVTSYPIRNVSLGDKPVSTPGESTANGSCWAPGYVGRGHSGGAAAINFTYGGSPYYDRSSAVALQNGAFWPYLKSLDVFKCPADRDFIRGVNRYADRSYSMNSWMNGLTRTAPGQLPPGGYGLDDLQGNPQYQFFVKESQMRRPSKLFVFVDEDPLFIDDAMFLVSMGVTSTRPFLNYPSRVHGPVWNWSFADGHIASQRMNEGTTIINPSMSSVSSKDWQVITNATTEPRNGP